MPRFWNSSDRLLLTLLIAAIIHAIVILGITFDAANPSKIKSSLEITLVTNFSKAPAENAEFLAPEHQIGGGKNANKALPHQELTPDSGNGEEIVPAPNVSASSEVRPQRLLTQEKSTKKIVSDQGEHDEKMVEHPHLTADALKQQIAEFAADFNRSTSDQAHGPKLVDINQVSANKYLAAAYESAWQKKIERIGTLNFPDEARRKGLSGSLTLSVGIKSDGSIYSVRVEKSSGFQVLDDAAKHIVQMAAPYSSLPSELRQQGDVLLITRKWTFFADNRVETAP